MKRIFAALLACAMALLALTGCAGGQESSTSAGEASQQEASVSEPPLSLTLPVMGDSETAYDPPVFKQLQEPQAGSPTVTLHTTMGDITMVLYPEEAPNTVENFLTHAKNGYYDGLSFHRVINDFMLQGGDPDGNGTGGTSIWNRPFEDEFSDNLHNFRGALSMANSGPNSNGSQFFIVQSTQTITEEDVEAWMMNMYINEQKWIATTALQLAAASGAGQDDLQTMLDAANGKLGSIAQSPMPSNQRVRFEPVARAYLEQGGAIHLEYKHTVFGQVIEGMDVVDAIAAVETGDNDKPVTDVLINSVTLGEVA